ncbi:MAG: GAF domain-containing protein [Stenomitos frigidus ULC029]
MSIDPNKALNALLGNQTDRQLNSVFERLSSTLQRDALIQRTTSQLRALLQVDRLVLYYFYRQWQGRVTFESLSDAQYTIFGSTGPDECFNGDYAAMYEAGRVRAIADIEVEPIHECHRDFLRSLNVRANLVVPILTQKGLWGLLVAHHCQSSRLWTANDVEAMQRSAATLATAPEIRDS